MINKLEIGDIVIVKSSDLYAGIKGRIKEVSPLNHDVECFIISIIDSEAFEKKFPKESVGNNTLENVYENREITIAHYNLEHDKQWYREKRLKDILGDE